MDKLVYKLRYLLHPQKLYGKLRLKVKVFLLKIFVTIPSDTHIESTKDTIERVRYLLEHRIKGAYLRFGDGDVNLQDGVDELLQKSNPKIKREMRECFALSGEGIVKCLPIHSKKYGLEPEMKLGLHESDNKWADDIVLRTRRYFKDCKVYSHVALSYLIVFNPEYSLNFLRYLKGFQPIFVGNENVSPEIVEKLFGKTDHIKTLAKSAFDNIDKAEAELVNKINERQGRYTVVVIAMGCTGRVLEKRIYNKFDNVFLFDFGSALDSFCEWDTRGWMGLTNLPSNYYKNYLDKI